MVVMLSATAVCTLPLLKLVLMVQLQSQLANPWGDRGMSASIRFCKPIQLLACYEPPTCIKLTEAASVSLELQLVRMQALQAIFARHAGLVGLTCVHVHCCESVTV